MEFEHWIILGLVGVCLLLFVRRRQMVKALIGEASSSGPTPDDKYLPIWVVLCMTFAVFVLSHQMTSIVKEVCGHSRKCDPPISEGAEMPDKSGSDAARKAAAAEKSKAEAETKVSEANAAAALAAESARPAASPATAASKAKGK